MKGVPKDSVVIDATAGLGQDSCALATLTDKLIILDKVPWIHALLQDGLIKAKKQISQFDRVYPVCSDSKCYLSMLKEKPDVIYLDPMFNRKNSSKAKREIQALRDLVDD